MLRTKSRGQRTDEANETVAIIIPTLNEERSIGTVIDDVPVSNLFNDGYKTAVYVIDGRSVDQTLEIAVQKGARVITEQRPGKGAAIQTAFRAVDADYVIVVDGDNTYPIGVATEMVRLLQTNDVVIGSRLQGFIEPGAMTKVNLLGNTLLTLLARALFGTDVTDVCTGLWGYRSDAIGCLELEAQGFEIEADMYAECARKGLRIAEIPIRYHPRADRAKLSSLRDGFKIGAFLCRKRLMARLSTPSATAQRERAATLHGQRVALVQYQDAMHHEQEWVHSSEFLDEQASDAEAVLKTT